MKTKINKSELFKTAWSIVRNSGKTISEALKTAWAKAKCSGKAIVIETYKYAGKMANGFHDMLFELTINGSEVNVSYASVEYSDYKPGKQNDCKMIAKSGAAIEVEGWKKRTEVLGLASDFLSMSTRVTGITYEVKDVIKGFGFRFDGVTKSWVK